MYGLNSTHLLHLTHCTNNQPLSAVNAKGSKMDATTYSNGDGHAVFTCVVWADDVPKSFQWKKEDAALSNVANEVSFQTHVF